jgi:hypothetical protein
MQRALAPNRNGSGLSAPAAQNTPGAPRIFAGFPRAEKRQRGGRCRPEERALSGSGHRCRGGQAMQPAPAGGNPGLPKGSHPGLSRGGQPLRPCALALAVGTIQERGVLQALLRGGERRERRTPMVRELAAWPTSKRWPSISLFIRHVKKYFAFCSSSSATSSLPGLPLHSTLQGRTRRTCSLLG